MDECASVNLGKAQKWASDRASEWEKEREKNSFVEFYVLWKRINDAFDSVCTSRIPCAWWLHQQKFAQKYHLFDKNLGKMWNDALKLGCTTSTCICQENTLYSLESTIFMD